MQRIASWVAIGMMLAVAPGLAERHSQRSARSVTATVEGTVLSFSTSTSYQSAVVRIAGPEGYAFSRRVPAGAAITFDLRSGLKSDVEAQVQLRREGSERSEKTNGSATSQARQELPDGAYHYELLLTDTSGAQESESGEFFAEGGSLVTRQAERAKLASIRARLTGEGKAGRHMRSQAQGVAGSGPVTNGAAAYDYFDIQDNTQDDSTFLYLRNYDTLLDPWSVENYNDTFQINRDVFLSPPVNALSALSSGNVGIGTTTPLARLDVVSGTFPQVEIEDSSGHNAAMGVGVAGLWIYDNNSNAIAEFNHGAPAGSLYVGAGGVGVNVGILGSATSPLDVQGKNGSGVNTTIDGGSLVVERSDSTPNIRFLKTAGTAQSWLFQNNSTSGVFAIRDETGGTSPVQIYPGAGAKLLQLQGTHVNVNGQIWQRGGVLHADYVFDPGYKLESIADHAKYMWKHKHLPAIAGVERDAQGREMVNLGAQQRGIVEELEEAHIYIAQLNEKDKGLARELASTKADLAAQRKANAKTQAEVARLEAALRKLEKSLEK